MFEIQETAKHLVQLMQANNVKTDTIILDQAGISYTTYDGNLHCYSFDGHESIITRLIAHIGVNPDLCIECMTDDHMNINPFFRNQMLSYVEFLMLHYGPMFSISHKMAQYLLKYDLLGTYEILVYSDGRSISKEEINNYQETDKFLLSYAN